jgi:PAS domain S-box-containing protein
MRLPPSVPAVSSEPALPNDLRALRRLLERLPAITFELRRGGAPEDMFFTYLSPQVGRITGYPAEEVMADTRLFTNAVHPDDRARVVAEVVRSSGEIDRFDLAFRIVAQDGRVTWLHARADPVTNDEGDLRWQGVALDVTEQKLAEEALRESEERYRVVVQNTWDLIVLADREGRAVYASPSHRAVLGVEPDEIVGTDVHRRVSLADVERSRSTFAEALRGVRGSSQRLTMRRHDGEEVVLEGSGWQPVFDDAGGVKLVLGIARDVTARVRAERERAKLFATIVEAQEQERARIANDLHDDPVQSITAVGLKVAALANGTRDETVKRGLEELAETVQRTVAGLRSLMFQLWPPALGAAGLAAAVDEYLAREFGDKIAYEVQAAVDPEPPLATRIVAYRVVQEALLNVRKHAEASAVLVIITRDRDELVVRVEDDGRGFDPPAGVADPRHIGLRAMRERVELAGGSLAIDSHSPGGTVVGFRLPLGS